MLRSSPPDGHVQGVAHQFGSEVVGDRPADHPPRPGVNNGRQIDFAFGSGVFGYVSYPQPIGSIGGEPSVDQIIRRCGFGIAAGATTFPPVSALQTGLAHQPLNPFTTHPNIGPEP